MSTDAFSELLNELGDQLKISLNPDHQHSCTLSVAHRFSVQMQFDPYQEQLWIVAMIKELPPGVFREEILRNALKENHSGDFFGVLGYFPPKNQLTLFQNFPIAQINGEKLALLLGPFIAYAERWFEAISQGFRCHQVSSSP